MLTGATAGTYGCGGLFAFALWKISSGADGPMVGMKLLGGATGGSTLLFVVGVRSSVAVGVGGVIGR